MKIKEITTAKAIFSMLLKTTLLGAPSIEKDRVKTISRIDTDPKLRSIHQTEEINNIDKRNRKNTKTLFPIPAFRIDVTPELSAFLIVVYLVTLVTKNYAQQFGSIIRTGRPSRMRARTYERKMKILWRECNRSLMAKNSWSFLGFVAFWLAAKQEGASNALSGPVR